jgi:hypothetical protein
MIDLLIDIGVELLSLITRPFRKRLMRPPD